MSKKFIMFVSTILLMVFSVLSACSCINYDDITKDFETDGYLYYYDGGEGDKYFVCGNTDKELPKVFQIPSHFNGKVVCSLGYSRRVGFGVESFCPEFEFTEKLFLPYSCELGTGWDFGDSRKIFYANNNSGRSAKCICEIFKQPKTVYITQDIGSDLKLYSDIGFEMIDSYRIKKSDDIIQIANTVYKFNYEGSPNDNIFFIDDYDGGEKLTAPWETPIREGYTFNGWYKEAECINKWDFENDVMPEFRYDENDERIFEITYLYAKWDKN